MVPRSVEQCRGVPSSAGKGWGRHWGAFKLLYYHCNTTKIDRVEQPRSAEVSRSAGKGWGRHWGAFKLLYYRCNTTKIDRVEQARMVCGAEECREVPRSAEECWEGVGQTLGSL